MIKAAFHKVRTPCFMWHGLLTEGTISVLTDSQGGTVDYEIHEARLIIGSLPSATVDITEMLLNTGAGEDWLHRAMAEVYQENGSEVKHG